MACSTTSIKTLTLAFLLLSGSVQAQTLLVVTNERSDVIGGPAFALSGPAGGYRMTYTVLAGGEPVDLSDGSKFRLEVWASDNYRLYNQTNTLTPEINASLGQLRFIISSLSVGEYRVRGVVTPLSGTNDNWNFTHHMLIVTSSASASLTVYNQHIASLQSHSVPTGKVAVTDGAGGVTMQDYGGGGGGGSLVVSNVVTGGANTWTPSIGELGIDTNANLRSGSASIGGHVITNAAVITFDAQPGAGRIGEVSVTGTTWTYGTNQPRGDILTYAIVPVNGTATVHAANGWAQRLIVTGATVIAGGSKVSTNHLSMIRLDIIGLADTNWITFDPVSITPETAALVKLTTGTVNSLRLDSPAFQGVSQFGVYNVQ